MSNFPEYHVFVEVYCQDCKHSHPCPVYCGDRFCPICSRSRLARVRHRLNFIIENTPDLKGHEWKMVTLSEPNCSDLREGIDKLLKSFRRLRQRQYWKNRVFGGVSVIEIKGRPGNWHPHIHAIVYSRYINWSKLHDAWKKCSTGSSVYISRLSSKAAVNYATKYMAKPDMPDTCVEDVNFALKGQRWMSPFGGAYKISTLYKKPKAECPECGQMNLFVMDFGSLKSVNRWCDYHFGGKSPPEIDDFDTDEDRMYIASERSLHKGTQSLPFYNATVDLNLSNGSDR